MIEAVIVDFDDTLCLTEAACFEMENETLAAMGREPMSRDVHINTWGQPLFDAISVRSPGIDVEKFKAAYKDGVGAVFVAEPEFDDSAKAYLIQVSVPVIDGGKAIGALTIGVNLDELEAAQ